MKEYKKLPQTQTNFKGVGIPGLTAELVKRDEFRAMYLRCDDVYEVFMVIIQEEGEAWGSTFPRQEHYPGNEDFGKTAWTYNSEKLATKCYDNLPKFRSIAKVKAGQDLIIEERSE